MAGCTLSPVNHELDLEQTGGVSRFRVQRLWPKAAEVYIPANLPDPVSKAFKEGCEILKSSPNAACGQFRRALELGLRELAPEVEAWKLEKRIDKLADQHLLTPALREWAHQLRLDGNEAVHGVEDATPEHAEQMKALSTLVLTYLFTLPKQVELARGG